MKISRKDKKLLLYAGGILLLVVVYFVFYRNITQKSDEMQSRVASLEQEKNDLEALNSRKSDYEQQIKEMQQQMNVIFAEFPADVREEDAIMYANELENLTGMEVSGISIGSKNLLYSTGQNSAEDGQAEAGTGTEDTVAAADTTAGSSQSPVLYLYGMPVTYNFTVDYSSFKKAVALIAENAEKRNMESLTLSFHPESGKLIGNAMVNMYVLMGGDSTYEEPQTSPIQQGVDNLFGTIEEAE